MIWVWIQIQVYSKELSYFRKVIFYSFCIQTNPENEFTCLSSSYRNWRAFVLLKKATGVQHMFTNSEINKRCSFLELSVQHILHSWNVFNTRGIRAAVPSLPPSNPPVYKFALTLSFVETKIQISKSCARLLWDLIMSVKHFVASH